MSTRTAATRSDATATSRWVGHFTSALHTYIVPIILLLYMISCITFMSVEVGNSSLIARSIRGIHKTIKNRTCDLVYSETVTDV